MRNNYFVYNRCLKSYNVNNNIKAIVRHLKKKHFIDFTINNVIEKRIREKIIINAVIFREIEINIKAEERKRKKSYKS